jgi:hypothetical protein
VQGSRKVATCLSKSLSLSNDRVRRFQQSPELILECIKVYLAIMKPLRSH